MCSTADKSIWQLFINNLPGMFTMLAISRLEKILVNISYAFCFLSHSVITTASVISEGFEFKCAYLKRVEI